MIQAVMKSQRMNFDAKDQQGQRNDYTYEFADVLKQAMETGNDHAYSVSLYQNDNCTKPIDLNLLVYFRK